MNDSWRERIGIDRAIHHGESCIKVTRVTVCVLVGSIADGDTPEQIIWPQLTGDDIKAALKFAAEAVNNTDSHPAQSRQRPVSARFKVDEDPPRQIADLLTAHGHDAATVVGQGW
jgi:uncharacterized protein (DUF433 family)